MMAARVFCLSIYSQSARLTKNRANARALGAAENAPPLAPEKLDEDN